MVADLVLVEAAAFPAITHRVLIEEEVHHLEADTAVHPIHHPESHTHQVPYQHRGHQNRQRHQGRQCCRDRQNRPYIHIQRFIPVPHHTQETKKGRAVRKAITMPGVKNRRESLDGSNGCVALQRLLLYL